MSQLKVELSKNKRWIRYRDREPPLTSKAEVDPIVLRKGKQPLCLPRKTRAEDSRRLALLRLLVRV